jgi:AcrR family transcriptional regulator
VVSRSREALILDAAGELLLVFGYRRVTIDDVARRAGVGKGTVYLHWSSKLELFATVLLREVAHVTEAQLATMRADPAEIRLHRTLRGLFLLVMRRPLARAFYTGDTELLGALISDTKIGLQFVAQKSVMGPPYLAALHEHGLLRDDPVADPGLQYRLSAATAGFFLLERLLPAGADIELELKADGLAEVVRRSFEPDTEPDPAELTAAAAAVIDLYQHVLDELHPLLSRENA